MTRFYSYWILELWTRILLLQPELEKLTGNIFFCQPTFHPNIIFGSQNFTSGSGGEIILVPVLGIANLMLLKSHFWWYPTPSALHYFSYVTCISFIPFDFLFFYPFLTYLFTVGTELGLNPCGSFTCSSSNCQMSLY